MFFTCVFIVFFALNIARDDIDLPYGDGHFAPTRLSVKKRVFSVDDEACERKYTGNTCNLRDFL